MKERLPPLGRRSPSPRHILCNGGLPDIDAELEKLARNPWCAHNGLARLISRMSSRISSGVFGRPPRGLDFQRQYRSEAGTMPTDHGLRPDDLQSVQHAR